MGLRKSMKVGIITDWTSDNNYGEILQCWALQQVLIHEGYDPFLIRFLRYNWEKECPPKRFSITSTVKRLLFVLLKIVLIKPAVVSFFRKIEMKKIEGKHPNTEYYNERNKERQFSSFFEDNIRTSESIYNNYDELIVNPPIADVYVTGSDQVWNFNMHITETKAFFLQFGDEHLKRISYAPSIGHNYWPKNRMDELRQYLSSFNAISVREKSGVEICRSVGYEATHVLDPTLLLSEKDYIQLIGNTANAKEEPYIYIYSMNYSSPNDIAWKDIKQYAKEFGLKIKVTPGAGYTPCREIFDDVEYDYATIPSWISNIANAQLVITASFHGSVFSILFHKHLLYTPLKGKISQSNNRVVGLLNDLGLDCMIYKQTRSVKDYVEQEIDWVKTDNLINVSRDRSLSYIRNAIKN